MVAITVLLLVARAQETEGPNPKESALMESVARICVTPAQRLGYTQPHPLQALVNGLLSVAQATLRKRSIGGIVFAHVRYQGNGAFKVNIEIQPGEGDTREPVQEIFSGGIVNLDCDDVVWTQQDGSAPALDVETDATEAGAAYGRLRTPSQHMG